MAIRKLWGTLDEDVSSAYADSNSRMLCPVYGYAPDPLESIQAGIATHVRSWTVGAGNQKCGIWNGAGDTLLAQRSTDYSVVAGWNYIPLDSSINISATTGYIAGAKGDVADATGRRPILDAYSLRFTASYSDAFIDALVASGSITNSYEPLVQIWGWIPPTINSINGGSSIANEDTSVPVIGVDFMDSGATLELCNNSDYASATTKVAQTVTSQADDELAFTVSQGALSAGTVYAFVTTDLGQINTTGFSVTLTGGAPIVESSFYSMLGFNF